METTTSTACMCVCSREFDTIPTLCCSKSFEWISSECTLTVLPALQFLVTNSLVEIFEMLDSTEITVEYKLGTEQVKRGDCAHASSMDMHSGRSEASKHSR